MKILIETPLSPFLFVPYYSGILNEDIIWLN